MINPLKGTWATFQFELARSMTWQRLGVFAVLSLFPPAMVFILVWGPMLLGPGAPPLFADSLMIFLAFISTLLGLLLWGTTNVYTELEGKSWVFLASRPAGRASVVLGKFLAAFALSFLIGVVAITLCILITTLFYLNEDPLKSWFALLLTCLWGCLAYSAIFSLIGVLFYRRSMVFCAGYLLVFETALPMVPALISRFTIRFHLQEILFKIMNWSFPGLPMSEYRRMFPEMPLLFHFAGLLLIASVCLGVSCLVVVRREYITGDDS